jgi:D-amino-acid dehydrogenase
MRICVLGAGVIGLTTAWALTEAGFEVVIVDGAARPGQGASQGNGAQLSYNFVAPLASPETLRHLPAMLLDRDGPLRIRPSLDPSFLRWGIDFLRACTARASRQTTAAQLALAALSRSELDRVQEQASLSFGRSVAGKLVVYRNAANFAAARRQAESQRTMGAEQMILGPADSLQEEPGLRIPVAGLAGAVFTPSEEVGDCALFCDGLAEHLRQRNTVSWQLGSAVQPVLRDGELVAVSAGGTEIAADAFVLCLGSGSARFADACGFRLPIQSMKGYSLTLRPRVPEAMLRHSVTDADRKVVFAPISRTGDPMIRVAGIAEMIGDDRRVDPKRLALIRANATAALDVDQASDPIGWAGLRPATPDSRPIIGRSPVRGLWLNTGHGALGWTLACGSARVLTDLVLGTTPPIAADLFALSR